MDNQNDFARNMDMKVNLGLLAASFAVILSLLQVEKLDSALVIALVCFSAILPINIYFGFLYQLIEDRWQSDSKNIYFSEKVSDIFTYAALFVAGIGFWALLAHFARFVSDTFLVVLGITTILFYISRFIEVRRLKRLRREKGKSPEPINSVNIEAVDKPKTREDQATKKKKSKKNKNEEVKK